MMNTNFDMNVFDFESFDDRFDIIDNNDDDLEYTNEELNHYYMEDDYIYPQFDDHEEIIDKDIMHKFFHVEHFLNKEQPQQEEILSQKLSQLSTHHDENQSSIINNKRLRLSTEKLDSIISKKSKLNNDFLDTQSQTKESHCDIQKIPIYLSLTNELFRRFNETIIHQTRKLIHIEDLQKVAHFIHEIKALKLKKQISITYLQSGTGHLSSLGPELISVDRRVWPMQVKAVLLEQPNNSITTTTMNITQEEDHALCENLVRQRLKEIDEKILFYQQQLDEMKNNQIELNSDIEMAIENFVQKYGIEALELKSNLKIAFLKNEYNMEIVERRYQQEKPNTYQIEIAQRLYETRIAFEKAKGSLKELKYRVFYHKLSPILKSNENSIQHSYSTTEMIPLQESSRNTSKKHFNNEKINLMALYISTAEKKYDQCQKQFHEELSKMWQNHRNLIKNQGMTTTLTNLIEQRLTLITEKYEHIYNYRLKYYLENDFHYLETMKQDDEEQIDSNNELLLFFCIDTNHTLTKKEIELLNRGPSYIPPGQLYLSLYSSSMNNENIMKRKYIPLKHELANIFSKYRIHIATSMDIEQKLSEKFQNLFSISLSTSLKQRAIYEQQLIVSIRRSLTNDKLILRRTADHMNRFYLGNLEHFQTKIIHYLTTSDSFQCICNTNTFYSQEFQRRIEKINITLITLQQRNAINLTLMNRLLLDSTKIQLSDIDFLPDISDNNDMQLVPIISSLNTLTSKVGIYLNQLLQPWVHRIMKTTTFYHDIDFIQKLNDYTCTQNYLDRTTIFCTIKITNYHHIDSHENMVETVLNFLQDNLRSNKIEQISMVTFKILLQLFLMNNLFHYNQHIYTYIKGSPTSMSISETLSNIYIYQWQMKLLNGIKQNNEFFGRYQNEIFFTWKNSQNELNNLLETMKIQYTNVHFQTSIGTKVNYLNLLISNRNGELYTRVNRSSSTKNYLLPYVTGYSKLSHSHWFRTALIRAVCCCSSVDDFHEERIYLELTFLLNGYSLLFVERHVEHFLNYFHTSTMHYSMDEIIYRKLRQVWLVFVQSQAESQEKFQFLITNSELIRLHYLYEIGPRCQFNQEFQQLWSHYFKNHSIFSHKKVYVMLTTKQLHSLNILLAQSKLYDELEQ